jgi:hypothetical protein
LVIDLLGEAMFFCDGLSRCRRWFTDHVIRQRRGARLAHGDIISFWSRVWHGASWNYVI